MDEKLDSLLEEIVKVKAQIDNVDNRLKKVENDKEREIQELCSRLSIIQKKTSHRILNDSDIFKRKNNASNTDLDLGFIWNEVLKAIQKELTEVSFNTWMKVIKPLSVDNEIIYLLVPNEFTKGIIEARYSELIMTAIKYVTDKKYDIIITCTTEKENELIHELNNPVLEIRPQAKSKYNFDNLVIGDYNRFAYKSLSQIIQNPKERPSLTYIFGEVGLGKTHMLKALENSVLLNHPSIKVKYMHIDDFIQELIKSISKDNNDLFRENIIDNDILILDDLHHIIGKERCQEELIKILNTMIEKGRLVIIGCTKSPQEVFIYDEKFTSLFEIENVIEIAEPDINTRTEILIKQAENLEVQIDKEVITLVAGIFTKNIRELINGFNRVIFYSNLTGEEINTKLAITALTGFSAVNMKKISENYIVTHDYIKIGKKYRHFKGKEYLVLSLAKHSETLEELVVYQALYGDYGIWVRPLSMFVEQVEVDGKIVNRFGEIE